MLFYYLSIRVSPFSYGNLYILDPSVVLIHITIVKMQITAPKQPIAIFCKNIDITFFVSYYMNIAKHRGQNKNMDTKLFTFTVEIFKASGKYYDSFTCDINCIYWKNTGTIYMPDVVDFLNTKNYSDGWCAYTTHENGYPVLVKY